MEARGSVCEKHGEYSPSGICRWCDPEATGSVPASKERGGFTHFPGLCTCTACIISSRPAMQPPAPKPALGAAQPIPKHPLPQWALDQKVVCYGGCACGEFVVHDEPAYVFLSASGVKHSAFGCLPVASGRPKAKSLSEIYRGKP